MRNLGVLYAYGSFFRARQRVRDNEICRALQPSEFSLKHFCLDTMYYTKLFSPVALFQQVPKTKKPKSGLDFLLENNPARAPRLVDLLPTSIASLTLRYRRAERWSGTSIAHHLRKLVQCSMDDFPR